MYTSREALIYFNHPCERCLSVFIHSPMHFCVYLSQQDAQEFLRFLLDRLHTEINRRPFVRRPLKDPEEKYTRFRYVLLSSDSI